MVDNIVRHSLDSLKDSYFKRQYDREFGKATDGDEEGGGIKDVLISSADDADGKYMYNIYYIGGSRGGLGGCNPPPLFGRKISPKIVIFWPCLGLHPPPFEKFLDPPMYYIKQC